MHFGGIVCRIYRKDGDKVNKRCILSENPEDTDKKREVENGVSLIVKGLNDFGIEIDEGMLSETDEKGAYGPYTQSKRKIYIRHMLSRLLSRDLHIRAL